MCSFTGQKISLEAGELVVSGKPISRFRQAPIFAYIIAGRGGAGKRPPFFIEFPGKSLDFSPRMIPG